MSQKILNSTKTTRPTKKNLNRDFYIFDASKESLGRLASKAATVLTGKNRADYAPDVDMGGIVVVINASKTVLTGRKPELKNYFRHHRRTGSLKARSFQELMALDATRPLYLAIKRMLPKNRHQDLRMNNRVHIFEGEQHNITHKMIVAN